MRERGRKRAFRAGLGLGGLGIVLCAGVVSVSSHSTGTSAPTWLRTTSDLIVAPAHAEKPDKRSRHKGAGDHRQAEAALKQAQQSLHQAEAARKRLQEAETAQKRIQQMQEAAATAQKRIQDATAAQKRMQELQRIEAVQKHVQRPDLAHKRLPHSERQPQKYQPAVSPPPTPQAVPAVAPKVTAVERHRAALEQTMAKLRVRHDTARQETIRKEPPQQTNRNRHQALVEQVTAKLRGRAARQETVSKETPRQTAGGRHQVLVEQMTAKLRGRRQQAPQQHANTDRPSVGTRYPAVLAQVTSKLRGHGKESRPVSSHDDRSNRDGFGGPNRQSALASGMDRPRGRRHADRDNDRSDRGRSGHGHHEPRQHAMYRMIAKKFSPGGKKSREEKEEVAAASQPAPVQQPQSSQQSTTPKPRSQNTELLLGTSDLSKITTNVSSKLSEIASNVSSKTTSESDNTMSRLGGPQQPSSDERVSGDERSAGDERRAARSRAQKKDDDQDNDASAAAKPAGRNLGRRVAGSLLPPPGTFKPNEVLAVDMDAAKLARALARNFKLLEKIEYPALGFSLTRLATPDTQNAVIARTTLHEELPSDGFGLNHIYAAGRVAAAAPANATPNGPDPGGGGKAVPLVPGTSSPGLQGDRRGGGCAPDRCFGVSVINWQPQLAACARGIKIGIIDTGVDEKHPAFAGVHFKHESFVARNAKKPSNHHGTGVFSLLAGSPRSSTPGLVPDATFFVGDAFFADGNGNAMSDTVTMLKALNWLKASGVDIANLSFAGPRDELVQDAIRELAKTGTVILAAAGNEGQDAPPSYPAAYKEVIAVTAVDRNLAPYVYANRGSHIDVAAPGVDVWTALPNRREGRQTGTSFAVPFVTSVVALSYRPEERVAHADPLAPKRQALAQLQKNIKAIGGRGQSSIFGAGVVQAPSHCDPRGPAIVAKTDGWKGVVQTTSSTNPPTHLQSGTWTSTVLPVASRK